VTKATKHYGLIDALVFGFQSDIDASGYSSQIRALFDKALKKSQSYQSTRKMEGVSGEDEMVNAARTWYERKLVSITDDRRAADLAEAYVTALRSCYEWEGMHDLAKRGRCFE
jgi:hypothetical protein